MKRALKLLTLFSFVLTHLPHAYGSSKIHIVKKGDVLTKVLLSNKLSPIYGKLGSLQKTCELNELKNNGDLIFPNQKIKLPLEETSVIVETKEEQPSKNEVTSTEEKQFAKTLKILNSLEVNGGVGFFRLDAKDGSNNTEGYILSSPSLGYDVKWHQAWNSKFKSYLMIKQDFISFSESVDNRSVENNNVSILATGIGGSYRFNPWIKVGSLLGVGEELSYKASTLTSVEVVKAFSPFAEVSVEGTLLRRKTLALSGLVDYTYVSQYRADNVSFDSGQKMGGHLIVQKKQKWGEIKGDLFYSRKEQKSNQVDFGLTNTGVKLGLNFNF